ncbi:MAG TPA: VOC family protein [Gaiellaceae bacterium]|nr:VOC family protein [Gaiellaceae bacterium]HWJ43969.1 VOC family protein [Gaiellaceae bacterium]
MSPQLDAFGIPVRDMARAVPFYRKLGLEFPAGAENEGHVEARVPGGMRYMLDSEDVMRSFDPDWHRPTDGHLVGGAFRCESPEEVDRVYAELLEAGGSTHKEPWDAFWGQRYAQVKDPDGTVVDLYAPLPDS